MKNYDQLIIGWCSYWNQIFKSKNPIEPNYIKTLIFSESRFKSSVITKNNKKNGNAIGLIQITEGTLKILKDRQGELKDHYLILKKTDLLDPNINICAGIRWMFHKKDILKKRLGREPEWIDVIAEYKGLGNQLKNNGPKSLKIISDFKLALKDFEC